MRRLGVLLISFALLGCTDQDKATKDSGAVDAPQTRELGGGQDLPLREGAPPDLQPKLDKCIPGCHWDCFGGIGCKAGKVYAIGNSPYPCCTYSDPWPYPGPICSNGTVLLDCKASSCAKLDSRYSSCVYSRSLSSYRYSGGKVSHLSRLYCPSASTGRKVGDACATDEDCRPVAAGGAARLSCDPGDKKCAAASRPAAPGGYGKGCGLTKATYSYSFSSIDQVVKTALCSQCHAWYDKASSCVRQGCTMACEYDEDCPKGSVCLCPRGSWSQGLPFQFCAPATARDSSEGRTAGLNCTPEAADAGPG